jgi:outer membrane protein assembly factor BamB
VNAHPCRLVAFAIPLLATVPLLAAAPGPSRPQPPESRVQAVLRARAEAPAAPPSASPRGGVPAGHLLFSMSAVDNASVVRALPDVTGDGRDEVLVGIDHSGTDNVFCLDGASSGTASTVWSIETADGVSGGSPWGDQAIEPASDGDGGGDPDLLLATAWGGRTAYRLDGLAGAIQWRFDTYLAPDSGWVYSLADLGDLTGDSVPEVAFGAGSDNNSLYVVDGASGPGQASVVWQWAAPDAVLSVRNIGDVNGDLENDVVAAVGDFGEEVVCLDGGTALPGGHVLWSYPTGSGIIANAVGVLPDVTGDGVAEALAVVWTLDGSAVRALDGATGSLLWASTVVNDYGMMVDVLEDVTGDGKPEVIASSWENAVTVLNGADGSLVWKTPVGTVNGGDVWTARAIGDLDGDGHEDVIAGSFDYHVYALDGIDGHVLWAYDTGNRVFSVAPVGDLDGDGFPEVAAGTQDTHSSVVVYVLDGNAGLTVLFADGFESGDTSAWSASVP